MKKLICLASALMMLGLTACNSDLGPEYTTAPSVSNMSLVPHVAKVDSNDSEPESEIPEGRDVMLSCYFNNTYGWSVIYLYYRTLSAEEYEGKSEEEVERLWVEKWTSSDEKYKEMNFSKSFETAPVSNEFFSASIPGQPAGTRVRWDFGCYNQYGLGWGYLAFGRYPQMEYSVVSAAEQPAAPVEE